MKKRSFLLVLLAMLAAVFMTGCTAVITDDYGETYEIPLDDAEEMAKEYIAEEMQTYISDEIKKGNSLADILGIDEAQLEQIVREEIRSAVAEELGDQDIDISGEDVLGILMGGDLESLFSEENKEAVKEKAAEAEKKAGEAKEEIKKKAEDAVTDAAEQIQKKKDEKKAEEKKTEEKKAEEKKDDKKDDKKAEEKKDEKKDDNKVEEKKDEKKDDKKAEEKKDEKKDDNKVEEKKDEKKDDNKVEEKKDEKKDDNKVEEKKDEKKDDKKADDKKDEKAEDKKSALDDGSPWVDYSLKENLSKDLKTSEKDDFYLYANKDWLVNAELKPGMSTESSFTSVRDEMIELCKAVFEDEDLKSDDAKMVQGFYKSVLDWDARNEAGIKPLEPLFADIQKAETIEDLNDLFIKNDLKTFLNSFVEFGNIPSINDGSQNITAVTFCSLMLDDSAEYENRTEYGDRCYESNKFLVEKMLGRYGYKKDQADEIFERALAFEKKLARNIYTTEETMMPDFSEKRNNEMSRKELEGIFKNYPFFDILEAEGFGKADRFLVFSPDYVKAMDQLYVEGNVENIKAYLLCHLCGNATNLLDREAYEAGAKARNIVSGATGIMPDEEYAYEMVRSMLTTPMDKAFLEKYDATKMKKDITKLCEDVVKYYRQMLEEEDWLSNATKKKAIKKLDTMTINAVYPEKWEDYSRLSIDGLSYFDARKAINDYGMLLDAEKTGKKVDTKIWGVDILEVNAFYDSSNNSINIIRGILGDPFYREDMSREEMLGGVGVVIGHEISHAFDTSGAQYDEKGNFNNWWTDEDYDAFLARADKLVKYYNGITAFGGEKVRGENIQTEAIADLAGDKCMLGIAAKDKDFDYDKFFRANANVWKKVNTVEYEYLCLTQDVHPLGYLRVNAAFPQFDEFIDTYGIKEGDNMYVAPEDRVLVW